MPAYAIVALPVGIDREFTYLIPSDLAPRVRPGIRVIVPFGRRLATGLVVDLVPETTIQGIKPIRDVVDALPIMSEELLRLCRWMASYYLTTLGEVLRAAVPQGFAATSKRLVRPLPALTPDAIRTIERASSKRATLLTALLLRGPLPSTELASVAGIRNITPVLRALESAGLIETDDVLPAPRTRPQFFDMILLAKTDLPTLARAKESIPARKKRARSVLDIIETLIHSNVAEIPATELLKRAGASTAVLREFVSGKLLTIERREKPRGADYGTEEQTKHIILNADQQVVLGEIVAAVDLNAAKTFLLHGVTGSGKTQVYIEAIRHCLAQSKTAIVLVPEISLTPQIVRRFKTHFGEHVGVVHSRMSPADRHDVWRKARRGEVRVVIGPRSAVFAPLQSIGLLVVDEEHESSYKQYDATPRYHARDVAVVRGVHANAVVVLGSATPSVESFQNALTGKYSLLRLPSRIDEVPMPSITIVDMSGERKRQYQEHKAALKVEDRGTLKNFVPSSLSAILREKIADRLSRHEGIILLQNRRGFAPVVECPDCGYTERCEHCNVSLTYHATKKHLRCHYCGMVRPLHDLCPQCGGSNMQYLGVGTQRVEEDLARAFPETKILRMDLDTTSKRGSHDRILQQFESGKADILLGTQMVAKGLDFARVTLVGVVSADTQMLLPDFRATERTFQLLTQVAGRAGRSTLRGEVIIQTCQPAHYSLRHVVDHDAETFYVEEIATRKELSYPPFSRLMLVETRGRNEQQVRFLAEDASACLKNDKEMFSILGPAPALIDKINNQYRWHIIVKSSRENDPSGSVARNALRQAVRTLHGKSAHVKLIVDVDPVGLM